jgi:anti-anti-sigma factor
MNSSKNAVTLQMEGQMSGPGVEEVRKACERLLEGGAKTVIDLTDVTFLDGQAIGLLAELAVRGVVIQNATPFVAQQLAQRPVIEEQR